MNLAYLSEQLLIQSRLPNHRCKSAEFDLIAFAVKSDDNDPYFSAHYALVDSVATILPVQ
jgi:hypothetical protein